MRQTQQKLLSGQQHKKSRVGFEAHLDESDEGAALAPRVPLRRRPQLQTRGHRRLLSESILKCGQNIATYAQNMPKYGQISLNFSQNFLPSRGPLP